MNFIGSEGCKSRSRAKPAQVTDIAATGQRVRQGTIGEPAHASLPFTPASVIVTKPTPDGLQVSGERLPNFYACVRLLVDGEVPRPFSLRTVKPGLKGSQAWAQAAREHSPHQYARPRKEVEQEIRACLSGE